MRKHLYCGVDLHSNNAMYVITDEQDKQLLHQRLPNELPVVLKALAPYRPRLKVVAVESTYNWYWLVDGLQEKEYPVVLAHPSEMEQYRGIKEADDLTDAAFLARLARLEGLPTGYIYPKEDRPGRGLLRRGDHDCLTFVADQQVELIGQLSEKIAAFEKKVLEHVPLRPTYECLLTLP